MWNLKIHNKLVRITQKKQTHRNREQTSSYRWEKRGGKEAIGVGEGEAQMTGCKTGLRMYCITWGTEPIFYNNRKRKLTFSIVYELKNFKDPVK